MAKKKAVKKKVVTKRKVAKKKTSGIVKSAEAAIYLQANPGVKVADAVIALNEKFPGEKFVAANVYQAKNSLDGGIKKKGTKKTAKAKIAKKAIPHTNGKANLHGLAAQLLKATGSVDAAKSAIDEVAAVVEVWEKAPF